MENDPNIRETTIELLKHQRYDLIKEKRNIELDIGLLKHSLEQIEAELKTVDEAIRFLEEEN